MLPRLPILLNAFPIPHPPPQLPPSLTGGSLPFPLRFSISSSMISMSLNLYLSDGHPQCLLRIYTKKRTPTFSVIILSSFTRNKPKSRFVTHRPQVIISRHGKSICPPNLGLPSLTLSKLLFPPTLAPFAFSGPVRNSTISFQIVTRTRSSLEIPITLVISLLTIIL